jgi:2-dehydropantoate 2-reductase
VVGPGAIGGLYGGLLAVAGHEVHALFRSDADHVRRHGFRLESRLHDGPVPFVVHDDPATIPPVDAVMVATKTTSNATLGPTLSPLVGDGTIVAVLQNGLGVEGQLAALVHPGARLVGGMCFVCSNRVGPGHVRHIDYGTVTIAAHTADGRAAGRTEALDAVEADLAPTGIGVQVQDDLATARWTKLVWNIPFNGLSVVLDAATDELMADPSARALAGDLMGEVVDAAGACGRSLPDGFADLLLASTAEMVPYATSMKLDHDAGRPLEVEAIYDAPIAAARDAGCEVPRIAALAAQLHFLDRRAARRTAG